MKLREFVLWGFKLELPESRKFTLFNRSVCAHFERHFEAIETDGIYRVIVKLSEPDHNIGTTELSSSVLKFYKPFDFSAFADLSDCEKKRLLLDTLFNALIELCDQFDWPEDGFLKAYELVIAENFSNTYSIRKKNNSSRTMVAEQFCVHSTESFDCFIVVKDKAGQELYRKLLFSEEPDEFLFNGRIGSIKWLSKNELVHLKHDKTELARFEIKSP